MSEAEKRGVVVFFDGWLSTSPYTIFQECRPPAGHVPTWRNGAVDLKAYIQPSTHKLHYTDDEAASAYQVRLQEAVERQLLSDACWGRFQEVLICFVASMAREAGRKFTGFTVGFEAGADDCEIQTLPKQQLFWVWSTEWFEWIVEGLGAT